jgi:hypothetical protein
VERPSAFWRDSSRPLLLVPIVPKVYARDRAKCLRELKLNVLHETLTMTEKTYVDQVGKRRQGYGLCVTGRHSLH